MNIYAQRMEAIRRRLLGEPVTRICHELDKSTPWFSKWWRRYQELGPEGLDDQSRMAHNIANKTDERLEKGIVTLRTLKEQRDQHHTPDALIGAPSIAKELRELGLKEVPAISTLHNILKRNSSEKDENIAATSMKPRKERKYTPSSFSGYLGLNVL